MSIFQTNEHGAFEKSVEKTDKTEQTFHITENTFSDQDWTELTKKKDVDCEDKFSESEDFKMVKLENVQDTDNSFSYIPLDDVKKEPKWEYENDRMEESTLC